MTPGVRVDPSLVTVEPAGAPGALGDAESPVVLAGPAGGRPFLLEGRRVAVRGFERPGVTSVFVDGRRIAADVRTGAGPGVNVVVGPASLRRELVGPGGSTLEHTLVLPALPLTAIQWRASARTGAPAGLEISFTMLPGATDVRYRASPGAVRAVDASGDGAGLVVEAAVHPAPTSWTVVEVGAGGVCVTASVERVHDVTLLLAAGSEGDVAGALASAPHLSAHELKVAMASDPGRSSTLALASGVREMDHGVAWATARLGAALARGGSSDPAAVFWSAVGAVATGDDAGARAALNLLGDEPTGRDVDLGLGTPAPVRSLALLTAARTTLLTGDPGPALSLVPSPDALSELHRTTSADAWPWWSLALSALADALRWAASEETIRAIREVAARPPPSGAAASGGGVRLPVLGSGSGGGGPALLSALLRMGDEGRNDAARGGPQQLSPPLEGWARFVQGRPDDGYGLWRLEVARGLEGERAERGGWDPPPEGDDPPLPGAPGAARVLAALSHGLLGYAPDAPAGRVGLAPAIPGHVRSLSVRNVRVGTALLDLSYAREDGVHRFRLDPRGGDVPPMVVLKPSVPGTSLTEARVDGTPADLDVAVPASGRIGVRVQVPADGPRTVELSCV